MDAPTEHHQLVVVIVVAHTVEHGHLGGVGHRVPDVGSVYQFAEALHPEKRGPLAHDKTQRVHDIGLALLRIHTLTRYAFDTW